MKPKPAQKPIQYTRISENANMEKFVEMGKKVHSGEYQWAYYGVEGSVGYHYYKKKK